MFYNLTPSVISAAKEKLPVWLVVVIGIAAGVELLDYFCVFWYFLVIFYLDLKIGGALAHG